MHFDNPASAFWRKLYCNLNFERTISNQNVVLHLMLGTFWNHTKIFQWLFRFIRYCLHTQGNSESKQLTVLTIAAADCPYFNGMRWGIDFSTFRNSTDSKCWACLHCHCLTRIRDTKRWSSLRRLKRTQARRYFDSCFATTLHKGDFITWERRFTTIRQWNRRTITLDRN